MPPSDRGSELVAIPEESLCRDPEIEFVVVFGSQTTDNSHVSSDLDLAVKFAETLSSDERFQKRCFLSGNLQRTDAPFLDISDIERLPLEVAHEAVNGDFLCGDERSFRQFKTDIETSFNERRDTIRRRRQTVINRIAEGGLRG